MVAFPLAVGLFVVAAVTLAILVGVRALAPRIAETRDYSLLRHALWLAAIAAGAVLMFAARSFWIYLPVAVVVTVLCMLRAALDGQDAERQRVAFAELYAGLFLVAWALLVVRGHTDQTSASAAFHRDLREIVSHLVIAPWWQLFGAAHDLPAWAEPHAVVEHVVANVSENLAAAVATSSFGLSWWFLAYLSPRVLPQPGITFFPLPALVSVVFVVAAVASGVVPGPGPAELAANTALAVTFPALAAEGIALIHAAMIRLRSRRVLAIVLVLLLPVLPRLWAFLAFLGVLSTWLWLRRLVPPLRAGEGTSWHPGIGLGVRALAWTLVCLVALGTLDALGLASASPLTGTDPSACGRVESKPDPEQDTVLHESPWATFAIDATDRELPVAAAAEPIPGAMLPGDTAGRARALCEARGARLCTADEWYLACLCTYPAEAVAGGQFVSGELLGHRVRTEARETRERGAKPSGGRPVKRLLEGPAEIVVGAEGQILYVGGDAETDGDWASDCRHLAVVPPSGSVGVRCCR